MTRVPWNGVIVPDALGHDALMDEIACPDIYGLEDAGRPLVFKRRALDPRATSSRSHVGEPAREPHGDPGRGSYSSLPRPGVVPTQDVDAARRSPGGA